MQDTIEVQVEIAEDEIYGVMYVATNNDLGIEANGTTFEKMLDNLGTALAQCFEDPDFLVAHQFSNHPRVILSMEIPSFYID